MNSFHYDTEVMNKMYLKCTPDPTPELKLELKGSITGRLSSKEEQVCQSINTNQHKLFTPTELTKKRKRKTAIYTTKDTATGINYFFIPDGASYGCGHGSLDTSSPVQWNY
jgi:hypothetical protein